MGELGVTGKHLAGCLVLAFLSLTVHSEQAKKIQPACTSGSLTQLNQFFFNQDYLLIARGTTNQQSEMLFIVSSDMNYFHVVDLVSIDSNYLQACINSSAREIDYQHTPPVPGILERINRAHIVFADEIPSKQECRPKNEKCSAWNSALFNQQDQLILTGYEYSASAEPASYDEPVELKIDHNYIYPSRGELAELARTKYALRLTNQLRESKHDQESVKKVYREMYENVDHKLALISFSTDDNHDWIIQKIDRESGLVWTLHEGTSLHMYPLSDNDYIDHFRKQNQ